MESLTGFIKRHARTSKEKFLASFPHAFLVSKQKPVSEESLFPGAWVISLKKEGPSLKDSISLGRRPDQDIQIDDDAVSKQHCYFDFEGDTVQIVDVNSTNGTTVNGRKLAPHAPFSLSSGNKIALGGKIELYFFSASDLFDSLLSKVAEKIK